MGEGRHVSRGTGEGLLIDRRPPSLTDYSPRADCHPFQKFGFLGGFSSDEKSLRSILRRYAEYRGADHDSRSSGVSAPSGARCVRAYPSLFSESRSRNASRSLSFNKAALLFDSKSLRYLFSISLYIWRKVSFFRMMRQCSGFINDVNRLVRRKKSPREIAVGRFLTAASMLHRRSALWGAIFVGSL